MAFIGLPPCPSTLAAILNLPLTIAQLWRAIGAAAIVHLGVANWPIPYGWIGVPLARVRRRCVVINIECAFWRFYGLDRPSLIQRARRAIWERLNRACVRHSQFQMFTTEDYRREFLPDQPGRGHVIPASWIDEADIVTAAEADAAFRNRVTESPDRVRVLFAGRLVPEKGVALLLESAVALRREHARIQIDVLGEGEMKSECDRAAASLTGDVLLRTLGTVPYGEPFFRLLRDYDAVVVPSHSDEQPRIFYDAASQGIPILGSDTPGLRACVQDGTTGRLVRPGNVQALADVLSWAASHRMELHRMGLQSLAAAHTLTHREMHRRRWRVMVEEGLGGRGQRPEARGQ